MLLLLPLGFVGLSVPALISPFFFFLPSAAGKPWEFHQSYPGLWSKAQWHLWGKWPIWKWEHDSSPDHTACTGQHGEWTHITEGHCLLRNTFSVVTVHKANVTSVLWLACRLCQAKTKGMDTKIDIGVKYADKQARHFDDEKIKAGQCVIGLQVTRLVIMWLLKTTCELKSLGWRYVFNLLTKLL